MELEIIYTISLTSTMKQHQDLKLERFKVRHCNIRFSLIGYHQVRLD
jgi:hypothetical protein